MLKNCDIIKSNLVSSQITRTATKKRKNT